MKSLILNLIVASFLMMPLITSGQQTMGLEVNFENNLTLQSKDSVYYLVRPSHLGLNKKGEIFISDLAQMKILKFSNDGNYIKSIGKRGRGPGEILDITSIHVSDKLIYVADQQNYKLVTFDHDGNLVTETELHKDILWPRKFVEHHNNLVMLYKLPSAGSFDDEKVDNLLHVYDLELSKSIGNFASFNSYDYNHPFADHRIQLNPGGFIIDSKKLYFTPGIYNGQIKEFGETKKGWVLVRESSRKKYLNEDMYQLHSINDNPKIPYTTTTTAQGKMRGTVKLASEGISLIDNKIVVFYSELIPNKKPSKDSKIPNHWAIKLDVYNKDLEYIGTSNTIMKVGIKNFQFPLILSTDKNDIYYYEYNKNEEIIVQRAKITIKTNE